jgi:DNA-binding NarL/FixJ family response regulator
LIRVRILSSSAIARAGFESLLAASEGIEVVDSISDADVVLREDLPDAFVTTGATPIVVITEDPFTRQALHGGVRAILSRDAAPEQIVAALYAAAAGLIAVPAEFGASVVLAGDAEFEVEALTPRETEVLEMLAEGLGNKQIAARLNISEHTAKFHVNSILGKLHAGTRTEAVMRGIRSGLVKV